MQVIKDKIRYIGVDDENLDLFEGQYPVPKGISYNSYIIEDERIAIVDAVDLRRKDQWLSNLADALCGRKPDYLIVQHLEPDHSGSVAAVMGMYPEMKVVLSPKAAEMLPAFFEDIDLTGRTVVVRDGEELSLGAHVLRFFAAPMVHWPEVVMTLDVTAGVLFSADAFGTFATPSSTEPWDDEARRYYCNIVGKYGPAVQAVMKKLAGQVFDVIAPLHGPVLADNLAHYLDLYSKWSRYVPETKGVLVAYASVYGGTADAARRIATALREAGAGDVVLFDLCRRDVSYAVAEVFRLSAMVLCSVTYDARLYPAMEIFISHIASKNLRNRTVALVENGSWAPIAAKLMRDELAKMSNITIVDPTLTIRSRLHTADTSALNLLVNSLVELAF